MSAARPDKGRPILVTGGSGFIGCNLADRLLRRTGSKVLVLDNLSRPQVSSNLEWLRSRHGDRVQLIAGDVRDRNLLDEVVAQAGSVFHLAAQVAVTSSLDDPSHDLEVNLWGTHRLLEAIRRLRTPIPLLFTSTNKIYGALEDVALTELKSRLEPADPLVRAHGFSESRRLEFQSPYGCSKGAADQYVLEYARSFGIPAVVFRMSCVYGPRQFGTEDQGWVAHFVLRVLRNQVITLYGDGRQVRDLLYIDDLVDAMVAAQGAIGMISGRAFNIGGGPANTASLLEVLDLAGRSQGHLPELRFARARPGDQRYYVSDVRAFSACTGWAPRIGVREGIGRLQEWLLIAEQEGSTPSGGVQHPGLPVSVRTS